MVGLWLQQANQRTGGLVCSELLLQAAVSIGASTFGRSDTVMRDLHMVSSSWEEAIYLICSIHLRFGTWRKSNKKNDGRLQTVEDDGIAKTRS